MPVRNMPKEHFGGIQKRLSHVLAILLSCALLIAVVLFITDDKSADPLIETEEYTRHQILPGDVFDPGGYIMLGDLEFLYTGKGFDITNNSAQFARFNMEIVGLKESGEYEFLQMPSFGGVDEIQYQKDFDENGWAIKNLTNIVRPGEKLYAEFSVFDFHDFGSDYPDADIDGDGYGDIIFYAHMQDNDTDLTVSADDPISEVYKLKAE